MIVVSILLLIAALFSFLFYGVGFNHLFLFVSSACGVLALSLAGPRALFLSFRKHPYAISIALLLLIIPAVHQIYFTTVAETSFSPTWILAAGPLWFLAILLSVLKTAGSPAHRSQARYLPIALVAGLLTLMVWVGGFRFLMWGERPKDPLADPTSFGILVYLALVPAVHWWLCGKPHRLRLASWSSVGQALLLATFFMAFATAFATASRANIALLGLAVVVWLVLGVVGKLNLRRAVGIALIGALGLVVTSVQSSDVTTTLSQDLHTDTATEQRLLLLEAGLTVAQNHAPWGVGLFGFGLEYPAIRSPEDQSSAGLYVHNDYLQLLAEGGILFAVALLLLVAGVTRLLLRQLRLQNQGQWSDPRAGGALALCLCMLHACVTFVFYSLSVVLVMGVVAAWCFIPLKGAAPRDPVFSEGRSPVRVLLVWCAGIAFAWLNLVYLALDSTSLAVFSAQPGLPGTGVFRESVQGQRRFATLAKRLNSDRSLPDLFFASDQANVVVRDLAEPKLLDVVEKYRLAIERDPRNTLGYLQVANLVGLLSSDSPIRDQVMQDAGALLDDGLRYMPNDLELVLAKFHWLEDQGRGQEAFDFLYERTLPWLDRYWTRSPAATLELFEILGGRALAYQNQAAFETIKRERARQKSRKDAVSQIPSWFLHLLRDQSETIE